MITSVLKDSYNEESMHTNTNPNALNISHQCERIKREPLKKCKCPLRQMKTLSFSQLTEAQQRGVQSENDTEVSGEDGG